MLRRVTKSSVLSQKFADKIFAVRAAVQQLRQGRKIVAQGLGPRNSSGNLGFSTDSSRGLIRGRCAHSTRYAQAGSGRVKSRPQTTKTASRRPVLTAVAASALVIAASFAWRLQYPATKLRFATTAAITTCRQVLVLPK